MKREHGTEGDARLARLLRAAGSVEGARQVVPEVEGAPPPRGNGGHDVPPAPRSRPHGGPRPGGKGSDQASKCRSKGSGQGTKRGSKGSGQGTKRGEGGKGRGRRRSRGEGGQLLLLAGMVLVLAFLLAIFAVNELTSEQARIAQGGATDLPSTFRENRIKIATTLGGLTTENTDNSTFLAFFNSTRAEVEQRGRSHGLHVEVRLGNASDGFASKSELNGYTVNDAAALECPGPVNKKFTGWAFDGARDFSTLSWDCLDDAIIWDRTAARIRGAVVWMFMASAEARLEESFLVAAD